MARDWAWGLVCFVLMTIPAWSADPLILENFDALPLGELAQENGWVTDPSAGVVVQGADSFRGGQAVSVVGADIAATVTDSTATNVWVDFYTMPILGGSNAVPTNAGAALFFDGGALFFDTDGYFVVLSNATWVTMDHISPVSTGLWYRISINIDYDSRTWGLYVADDTPNKLSTVVATNLAFQSGHTNTSFSRFEAMNSGEAP
jgi:hypothetical protein